MDRITHDILPFQLAGDLKPEPAKTCAYHNKAMVPG